MATLLDNYFAIAEETTYGTAIANAQLTRGVEGRADTFTVRGEFHDNSGFHVGKQSALVEQHITRILGGSGSIQTCLFDKNMGLLLKNVLGSSSSAALSGAAGAFTQEFETTSDGPTKSYTIQINRVDVDGTDQVYTYAGCVPTGFSFRVNRNDMPMVQVDFDFAVETHSSTKATPTYPTANPYAWDMFELQIDGADVEELHNFSLTAGLMMKTDRFYLRGSANSTTKKQPVRMGVPTYTGNMDFDLTATNQDLYTKFKTGDPVKLVLTGTHSEDAGTGRKAEAKVTIEKAILTGQTPKACLLYTSPSPRD